MAAGADGYVRDRENGLCLCRGVLAHLGERVDDATDETDEDGGNAAECDGGVEEDQAAKRDGELVQSPDHGVCCRGCDADGPRGSVGDEDRGEAGQDHDKDDGVALVGGEVLLDVGRRPVFDDDGCDQEDGNGEQVVVVHS